MIQVCIKIKHKITARHNNYERLKYNIYEFHPLLFEHPLNHYMYISIN